MKTAQKGLLLLIPLILAVIAAQLYRGLDDAPQDEAVLSEAGVIMLPQPRETPDLELIDQNGEPLRLHQLAGRWSLVSFGYTFCPDICPTTLAELRNLQARLPEATLERLRTVLVTVDPHRDTPEQLRTYLGFFDAEFLGLTGDLEHIQALSNVLGIPFIPGDTSRENYTVDHSGNLAIIGPDARLHGFVRYPLDVPKLAEVLPRLVERDPALR
ncbi:SCO family protein [Stutzerimonas tarimensis]|uniref:SCO family protein n=1 Tax=Stutzerimonas tarimensis TaxID=1507735 RepID=A0ABV7T5Z5_9GAMM